MAKIEEIVYNILEDKWHKSFDDDDDPFDAWQKTLEEHGCIEQISVEANWDEDHGVPRLIRSLIKIINEKDKYLVTGDPSCMGSSQIGYLVFPRVDNEK